MDRCANERTSDAAAWVVVAALLAVVLGIQLHQPLSVALAGFVALTLACVALGGAALFYGRVRTNEDLSVTCVALIQVLLFSAFGCILSYMLARTGGQLWDQQFSAWDRALGLDWLAYIRFVDSHPWLVMPLRLAYGSMIPQIIVLLLALGFSGRLDKLRRVILAAIICGTATVLLSPLFPAVSSYVHLGLTVDDFRHVDPWAGYAHLQHYSALRDGTVGTVRLREMQGIITFPSYHAGLSTVTLWGFWMVRPPLVRWLGMVVAAATIAATPVDGGHYFVDVIAGIAVAIPSIAITARAVRWCPAPLAIKLPKFRPSDAAFGG